MWGGTPSRNMVSTMTGLPTTWDVKTGKNVKWVAELGSQSYGNPTVAGGVVLVGTNNEAMRDPKQPGDRGVLMAFREATGEFLWQATFEKLSSGRANDWPFQGIASSPLIDARRRLLHVQSRPDHRRRSRRASTTTRTTARSRTRSSPARHDPDIIWIVRHDGGGRRVPAQPRQLLAGGRRRTCCTAAPATARTKATSTSRRRRRRRSSRIDNRRPASWCGKTTRSAIASCTASGRRRRSATSAA